MLSREYGLAGHVNDGLPYRVDKYVLSVHPRTRLKISSLYILRILALQATRGFLSGLLDISQPAILYSLIEFKQSMNLVDLLKFLDLYACDQLVFASEEF